LFGVLASLLSVLVVGLMPISFQSVPNPWIHVLLFAAPTLLAFGFWVWQVSLFRPVKAFGEAGSKNDLRDHSIYLLVVAMACLLPAWHGYQVSLKIAHSISDQELVEDLNQLSLAHPFALAALNNESGMEKMNKRTHYFNHGNYIYYSYHEADNGLIIDAKFKELREEGAYHVLPVLDVFLNRLEKYSPTQVSLDANEIYRRFQESDIIYDDGSYQLVQAVDEARENLQRIQMSKTNHNHFFQDEALRLLLIIFLYTSGLLLIGLEAGGKAFLLSAVAGIGILIGGVFAAESLHRLFMVLRSESWLGALHLGVMAVLGLLMLKRRHTQKGIIWRRIVLSLFTVGLAMLPMSVWQLGFELNQSYYFVERWPAMHRDEVFDYVFFGGAMLPLLLWNLGLRQAFQRLLYQPKKR
ncbi:MAG: hypothetical protein AAFQ87_25180, partial [Bacteroidota bacterium]